MMMSIKDAEEFLSLQQNLEATREHCKDISGVAECADCVRKCDSYGRYISFLMLNFGGIRRMIGDIKVEQGKGRM